jgi:hypothetical protein
MILQNMTPEEKINQASRLELDLRSSALSWVENNQRTLKKRKTYPFRHVIRREYKGMGKWNIILGFSEKPNFRKGVMFSSNAYQKFYVDYGAKAENIGAGIYMIGGSMRSDGIQQGISFYEFSPHFFHRFKQRYLERNNIVVDGFEEMALMAIDAVRVTMVSDAVYHHFGHSEKENDFLRSQNIPRCEGYDNLALFTRHGIILGVSRPGKRYECYLTYVDREDFYKGQQDIYGDVVKLYDIHDKLLENDPYYFLNRDGMRQQEMKNDYSKLFNRN